MTEKQEHLLKLMREIDEICKKHHLRYVMAGGSLIGVVRNEGFIPWDDDVDIYMPKSDWDRFVELSATEFPPDRAIHCVDVDREYTNTFPRYADTASCAIHRHQLIGNDSAGEIIDVLTLDPIPPDDREYEKYRTNMMIYSELVNEAYVYCQRYEIPVRKYLKYLLYYYILGRDKTLKKLEDAMFSYKEEDCSRYAMRWGGCPFLFDKDMMFPVKYMDFEGIKVMVPNKISDYLIWHYGDEWSYIPPHEERTSHNAITVEGITYQELRNDYMKKVNAGKIKRGSVFRKIYYIGAAKKRYRLVREKKLLKARSVEMDLEARIEESSRSLKELLQERDFAALNEIFSQYFPVQLSAEFIGREDFGNIHSFYHPMLLKVSDEVFEVAMMTLVYTERVAKAYRMLQVKKELEKLTPGMEQMEKDIVLFRKAASHYEMGEKAETEKICCELLERYSDAPGFLKLKCRLVMERALEREDLTEGELLLAHALEVFPGDGYFLKYQADLEWKKGNQNKALVLYAEARESTNNGITHLEIEKFVKREKKDAFRLCRELILEGKGREACSRISLWERISPENEEIKSYTYLAKAAFVQSEDEKGVLIKNLEMILENQKDLPEEKNRESREVYKEALGCLLKEDGYSSELAEIRASILLTDRCEKLEVLSARLKELEKDQQQSGIVWKLTGDVKSKLGCTKQAFACYEKALEYPLGRWDLEAVSETILNDLYQGGKKAKALAKRTEASDFMDKWLDRYGSLEQINTLVKKLMSTPK